MRSSPRSRADTSAELYGRALAFVEANDARLSTRIEPFSWGRALFHTDFPKVHDLNFLKVAGIPDEVTAADVAAVADRIQGGAGLSHRKIYVPNEAAGERLEGGFKDLGWQVERLVFMAHRRAADRRSEHIAREIDLETMKRERERQLREDPDVKGEDVIAQLRDHAGLIASKWNARFYGAITNGVIGSTCELYSDGSTAQIEAVITLEKHRNQGLARAVVLEALDVALDEGHDFVFLIADDDDWPKQLYSKLGFDPIGCVYYFTLSELR